MSTKAVALIKILGKNHSKCMVDHISYCWDKECYSNVTFICKQDSSEGTVPRKLLQANKAVLAAASKKLHLILSDTGDEETIIIIPESGFETIKKLLQYIYTGQVYAGNLREELESLIVEWDIGLPKISTHVSDAVISLGDTLPTSSFLCAAKSVLNEKDVTTGKFNLAQTSPSFADPLHAENTSEEDIKDDAEWSVNDYCAVEHNYADKTVEKEEVSGLPSLSVKNSDKDKADLLLSEQFLKKEMNRRRKLLPVSRQLTEAIKRHESYVKHFIDPNFDGINKDKDVEKDPRIPCGTCGKNIRRSYMKAHLVSSHSSERPFFCEKCGASFALKGGLTRHMYSSHPKESQIKTYACKVCSKTFRSKFKLRNHMTVHTGEKPHSCPFCDKKFNFETSLRRHKRIHTGEKPFLCNICGKQFSNSSNYAGHLKVHNKDQRDRPVLPKPFKCNLCDLSFHREYAFLVHGSTHTGKDPELPCRHCSSTFPSMKLLKEHGKKEHSDITTFSCNQCANIYSTKRGLEEHILLTHSDQVTAFPCGDCNKEFKSKAALRSHSKNVHSTKRPYKCQFCPKDFTLKKLFQEHERIHTGERPYQCPHCPKAFRICEQRNIHLRTHTGEKPYSCDLCEKTFSAKENLRAHLRIHTGEKNQCSKCGEIFRTKIKLKLHETTHKENIGDEQELPLDESGQ